LAFIRNSSGMGLFHHERALTQASEARGLFDRILVPLDGSLPSEAILYQARQLLSRASEVILFHVEDPDERATMKALVDARDLDQDLASASAYLNSLGIRARRIFRAGRVESCILQAIGDEHVSLLAMSSHGRSTSSGAPVADTVEDVLRASRIPILVARAYQASSPQKFGSFAGEQPFFRRILLPLDGSSASEAVVPHVVELGQMLDALIVVLHVDVEGPEGRNGLSRPWEQQLDHVTKIMSGVGLEILVVRLKGDPLSSILGFARPSAVDLIAMTTQGSSASSWPMGSVTLGVLRDAVIPTLVVRSSPNGGAPSRE
jgi:nucleotide-binding universal stress UspA family protein